MVKKRQDEATEECVVCWNPVPEGRLLTCCHDCYLIYKTDKAVDRRRARGVGNQRPHICQYCKTEFHTKYKRLRHRKLIHHVPFVPSFCSLKCKESYASLQRVTAGQVLGKFYGSK